MSPKLAHRLAIAAILAATAAAAVAAYFLSRDIAEEERDDRMAIAREATLDALAAREDFLGDLSALAVQPRAAAELAAFARFQEREEGAVVSVQWVPRGAAAGAAPLLVPPDSPADRDLALTSSSPLADRVAARAIAAGRPTASQPVQLDAGDAAFYLAIPARRAGTTTGALVALVDGRRMLAAELPREAPDVAVEDHGEEVATVGDEPEDSDTTTVTAHGRTWTVSVAGPSVGTLEQILPWAILLSGFALALVVALLLGRAVSRRDAALELARLRESELEQRSREDELTGIYNRRHFTETLGRALAGEGRDRRGLAVVLLDLDHFKAINDNHGHLTGDLVLQVTAQRLASVVRPAETLARWGGEEFAVLATGLDRDGALALGERLRAAIADAPIEVKGEEIELSGSVGVVLAGEGRTDPDSVVGAADAALYEAKAAGRNRVVVSSARAADQVGGGS